jgi:alanine or glycine:cation symporter, AGCS family
MFIVEGFKLLSEQLLFIPFVALLVGSIILSFRTRFIQIRVLPLMMKLLYRSIFKQKKIEEGKQTIQADKALFTAMSCTIGIGNIVAPVMAIGLGGPGALLGFVLATIFGSAATFTEVTFAVKYREKAKNGKIIGGPMTYLKRLSPLLSQLYVVSAFILLIIWETNQSNTLAVLLEPYSIPSAVSGLIVAVLVLMILVGGVKRVGNVSEKIVPIMFFLYCFAMFWILGANIGKLPGVIALIFKSAWSPKAIGGAAVGAGIHKAMHWGLAKGFFSNEAGVGVATIPHSMAEVEDPFQQGVLAMVSVYSNGILCLLSGLAILVTGIWQTPGMPFDINMIATAIATYFPSFGPLILVISALLFAFSTILGNGFNGGECFLFVTKNRWAWLYYAMIALVVFLGAVANVTLIWTITDFFMILVAVPHIIAIVILAFRKEGDVLDEGGG